MSFRRFLFPALLGAALIAGAGCARPNPVPPDPETAGVSFEKLPPALAAQRIQFMGGDGFDVRQTLYGMEDSLAESTKAKISARRVQISHFAPLNQAEISWDLSVDERTQRGLELVSASGTVENIELNRPHALLIPVHWSPGPVHAFDTSAVWLSDDAYQELAKTGRTALDFGIMDPAMNDVLKNSKDLQTAMTNLRRQAASESARKELTLLQAEKAEIDYPLTVNGKQVKVSAIRAKNWFGEIIVLKSRQNPLVLKFTMHPQTYGAAQTTSTASGLQSVFGFEITNLQVQALR